MPLFCWHQAPLILDLATLTDSLNCFTTLEPVHQTDTWLSTELKVHLVRDENALLWIASEGQRTGGGHGSGVVQASLGDIEPIAQDAAAEAARKISQEQMQRLYSASLVSQRSELLLVEGMAIREALQEKVCF